MTVLTTPGLYFQATAPAPAPALVTGMPAFIGRVGGYLDAAVRGFLANGGQRYQVVELAGTGAGPLDTALAGLDDSEADLICLPDLMTTTTWTDDDDLAAVVDRQRQVLDHCAARGDRFAVLDAVPAASAGIVVAQREALAGPSAAHGALYGPWVLPDAAARTAALVPPCGHVSGVYAAVDDATGAQRAPAGIELADVLDLQIRWDDAELTKLASGGVNAVRALSGRGFRIWGARTASDDPAWRDVTARRVINEIVRRLETFMTALTHEPNDVRLRVRIMRELTAYLDGLHQRGALSGATADDAFFVKCDDETNPPEVVALGQVVTQVGVRLAAQAEVVVLRVVRT